MGRRLGGRRVTGMVLVEATRLMELCCETAKKSEILARRLSYCFQTKKLNEEQKTRS